MPTHTTRLEILYGTIEVRYCEWGRAQIFLASMPVLRGQTLEGKEEDGERERYREGCRSRKTGSTSATTRKSEEVRIGDRQLKAQSRLIIITLNGQ